MTTVLDLSMAVALITEVSGRNYIYGFEFKQILDAIKVFRNYYAERKDSWGIPQDLLTELDGYIANFPTLSYHYMDRASDQNNVVECVRLLGLMSAYHAPVWVAGYLKKVYVHWLNPDGSIKQTWDYYANQKPKVPHWIAGTDYADGNVRLQMVWSALGNTSIRFDTRTYLQWSKLFQNWIQGSCISTPIVQDYSLYQHLKMPSEHVSQHCKIMDCGSGVEYTALAVSIEVTDVTPPDPLTASAEGYVKGYVPYAPWSEPIVGATVTIGTFKGTTDSNGYVKIIGIPVGYYVMMIEKPAGQPVHNPTAYAFVKMGTEFRSGDIVPIAVTF